MTKVRPEAGTGPAAFPKPVFGVGLLWGHFRVWVFWQGAAFSFSTPLKIPLFLPHCSHLVCPHGWGELQFHYEFQVQTWLCSPEHLRSGCWTCGLTCTNMNLPGMERLGRKCLLVTHFDSHWSVQDVATGITSHRLLELLSQSHNLNPFPSRAVKPHQALLLKPSHWLCSRGFSSQPLQQQHQNSSCPTTMWK